MVEGQLHKDPNGNVEFLDLWFESENGIFPPLLAYADLITSGRSRNLEAALEMEEKYTLFE